MASIKSGDRVTGECLCHGVTVVGTAGPVSRPGPYLHLDWLTNKTVQCWFVLDEYGIAHDIPLSVIVEVK